MGISNVDDEHPRHHGYYNKTIKPYADFVRKVADQNDLIFVDLEGLIARNDLKLDSLHLTASGHEKIFQKVKSTIL